MFEIGERVVDGKLHGWTIEHLCAAVEWRFYRVRRRLAQKKANRYIAGIEDILSDPEPSKHFDSEEVFARLQHEHVPPDPYGYDFFSTWRRASERTRSILSIPELQLPGKRMVELGAGDGMTARQLSDYGHDVLLCDIEDWRHDQAQALPFLQCGVCKAIPLEDAAYDLIYSYNSFEHLTDPHSAFREIQRLCRPGGLVLLSFNPIYCSPWGLHAYRAFNMPYPQFIFSRSFVDEKIKALGIYDLGRIAYSLQPLNQWRTDQFQQLWRSEAFCILDERVEENWSHLDMVFQYPEAFRGRDLTIMDLVAQGLHVLLQKRSS